MIPLKTRLLNMLARLCKNKRHKIDISTLNWQMLWEELISLCTRAKKYEIIASEIVLSKLMQSMLKFLHIAR